MKVENDVLSVLDRSETKGNALYSLANSTAAYVDPNKLEISDDPLPTERASTQKYEALFTQLNLGQCIKCQPDDVGKIANGLRKWASEHRKGAIVKSTSKYPKDGKGRVWLLPPEKKGASK